MKGPCKKDN